MILNNSAHTGLCWLCHPKKTPATFYYEEMSGVSGCCEDCRNHVFQERSELKIILNDEIEALRVINK